MKQPLRSSVQNRWQTLTLFSGLILSCQLAALPNITAIEQTGGIDTKPPKFTGQTFDHPNEGANFTVPFLAEDVPSFNDRTHEWNGAAPDLPIPDYLLGGEYIMLANDNRGNDQLVTTITIGQRSLVYILVDNRLPDGVNTTPPGIGDTRESNMGWLLIDGWAPVQNGLNRSGDPSIPDEVAVDEGGDGVGPGVALNQWSSVYVKQVDPGTFTLYQANNAGRNMYGVVVKPVPETPAVTSQSANLFGLTFRISDGSLTALDPDSVGLTVDDQEVDIVVTPDGSSTSVQYTPADVFPPESTHVAVLTFSDDGTPPTPTTHTFTFTIGYYGVIPASYALAAPATEPGFVVNRVFQTTAPRGPGDGNLVHNAEMHLAGGMTNPDGTPLANMAEFTGPLEIGGEIASDIWWTPYVNWEQASGLINPTDPQPDNFNGNEPPGTQGQIEGAYVNWFFPGIDPGTVSPADPNNFVLETIAYVRLSEGVHRWGVNSDDGFKVTVAPGQPSPFGILLGQYSGGRGASDTTFDFYVEAAGDYAIRLLNWEGNGGASCEWFSQDITTGEKILIGDTAYYPTSAYPVFRTGQGRAHISKLKPSDGYQAVQPSGPIEIEVRDGRTQASDVRLLLDGVEVATGTKAGAVTTINYTPSSEWSLGSQHAGEIIYTESGQTDPITNLFSFTVRSFTLNDLPAGTFWIEAEDWDHSSGQTVASASTMPYLGGAYTGLQGVLNVDYFDDNNNPDTDTGIDYTYRGSQRPNHANITVHQGANVLAIERPGGVTMTANYRLGWAGNFWGNYTRTIPAGVYKGAAALSHGDGTGIVMLADLDQVTSGVGTTDQELDRIGTFTGAGSTGWGSSILVPLKTPLGADAVFKLPGGPVTLRVTARNGDFDWFAVIPVAEAIAPIVRSITPNLAHTVFRDTTISIEIEEFTTQLDEDAIDMSFDGTPVTPTVNRAGDRVTISFDPPGLLDIGRPYPFSLTYSDDATPANSESISGTLVAHHLPDSPAGMFLIEAEDFNTDGGSVIPAVNTMPYLGNAYTNLSAVAGTDYIRVGDEPMDGGALAGNVYRIGESPNVPMGANQGAVDDAVQVLDLVRAMDANRNVTWQMDVNFSLGWAGTGHWFNYSRDIPTATYQIFAGMSFDGTGENQLSATLDRVTGPANVPDAQQVKEPLGLFQAPGTGGWGNNRLVPLRDLTTNELKPLELGGNTTLRFNWASGDFDYMILVPTAVTPPGLRIENIELTEGGQIRIEWTGAATLQSTTELPATSWNDVPGESGVEIPPPASGNIFFRLLEQ